MTDLYQELLLEAAKQPANQGSLAQPTAEVVERNASCGDVISVAVEFDYATGEISALKWRGEGCVLSQAAMSILSEYILAEYRRPETWPSLSLEQLQAWMGIEQLSPGRLKCVGLGLAALKHLAAELEAKQ